MQLRAGIAPVMYRLCIRMFSYTTYQFLTFANGPTEARLRCIVEAAMKHYAPFVCAYNCYFTIAKDLYLSHLIIHNMSRLRRLFESDCTIVVVSFAAQVLIEGCT